MDKRLERNLIIKESIILALMQLMRKKKFNTITITELVETAGVARASFYRNYTSKEDVILKYLTRLHKDWHETYHYPESMIESYFRHILKHKHVYLLLHQSGQFYLVQKFMVQELGPKEDFDNNSAYTHSWFAYGLYGWIEEWVKRGMQESPQDIAALYHNMNENRTIN